MNIQEKFCKLCKTIKSLDLFHRDRRYKEFTKSGYSTYCKPCHYTRHKIYRNNVGKESYKKGQDRYNSSEKGRFSKNKYEKTEKAKLSHKKWRNSLSGRKWHSDYQNSRCKVDVQYWLARTLRNRLKNALNGNFKSGSAIKQLGCSIKDLKIYLEKQFTSEMNWENKGMYWHIDHKVPLSSVDLTDINLLKKVCHYTNLRPLYWQENLSKGAR